MIVRSLNVKKNPFCPREDNEEILDPEILYLSAVGALIYLTNCPWPDISFATNLLAKFSSSPTRRHWNEIKHVFHYLRGITNFGLFYSQWSKQEMIGYLSDLHKVRSQIGSVFTCGGTTIFWRSQKQTLIVTFFNYAEVIALHEASRECVRLRSVTQHIQANYALPIDRDPIILFEGNITCVSQIKKGFIKCYQTKHIPSKLFSFSQ